MTHNHKHSNSEGAHGLFNWLFPSWANWFPVKLPFAAQTRQKIATDKPSDFAAIFTVSQLTQICVGCFSKYTLRKLFCSYHSDFKLRSKLSKNNKVTVSNKTSKECTKASSINAFDVLRILQA